MAEGQAQTFYQGEGEDTTKGGKDDPSTLIYYIVAANEYDEIYQAPQMSQINEPEMNDVITKYSCKLVGMVPCSDAFGVDLIIEKFNKKIAENEKNKKDLTEKFL